MSNPIKKFTIKQRVKTKYGNGVISHIDDNSLTVVVKLDSGDLVAVPRFEVKEEK